MCGVCVVWCVGVGVGVCGCVCVCVGGGGWCVCLCVSNLGLPVSLPKDSFVFGLLKICDSIKSRPTINICNISINIIRQNNYVSVACYRTKYSLLFQ